MNPTIEVIGGGAAQGAATGAAFGGIGAGIGAIVGGGLSMLGGRNTAKRMEILSQEQRAWEEAMSKTAHWWEAHDLESAGINRILTATGGAGMSYHGSPPAPTLDYVTPGVSSAAATGRAIDELRMAPLARDNIKGDTAVKSSSASLNAQNERLAKLHTGKVAVETENLQTEGKILKENLKDAQFSAKASENLMKMEDTKFGEILRWAERISDVIRGGGEARRSWRSERRDDRR